MDFINWYFKNKIQYLDNTVCANYTNNNLKDFYAYDFSTDFKPTGIPYDYVKYLDTAIVNKLFKDFKIVEKTINELCKECSLSDIIVETKKVIEKCKTEICDKDIFIRRHILHSSD